MQKHQVRLHHIMLMFHYCFVHLLSLTLLLLFAVDLTTLAQLIPSFSRLLLDAGTKPGASGEANAQDMMVPTSTVRAGDILQVLPGERIPVDGIVVSGICSVDESMLTGESELILKQPNDTVTGGTVAYEAPLTVRATSTGSSSTLAGIGRCVLHVSIPIPPFSVLLSNDNTPFSCSLVTEAQSREAPVQRLADVVAGWFCYGVMSASAATFTFWYLAGEHVLTFC